MEVKIWQDETGTHIDWMLEGVTAKMIYWFWSNMEKCNLLWHPGQHEPLEWAIAPVHGNPVGSIHIAPQTWSDGTHQNLYIRMEDPAKVPAEIKELIIYEHYMIASGLGFGPENIEKGVPFGYRLHQWQKTDYGVVGRSSALAGTRKETMEEGMVWARHCKEEIGNWEVFLPQLYQLYQVVTNVQYNPFANLSVEGRGKDVKYKYIKVI